MFICNHIKVTSKSQKRRNNVFMLRNIKLLYNGEKKEAVIKADTQN